MSTLHTLLSHPVVGRIGWVLVHSLWQATAAACVLAIVLGLMRKASANARYLVSCSALMLAVALPVATLWMVDTPTSHFLAGADPATSALKARLAVDKAPSDIAFGGGNTSTTPAETSESPKASWSALAAAKCESTLPFLVLAWLVGVFGLSLWHLGGWAQLQRLKRRMVSPAAGDLQEKANALARRLHVIQTVRVVQSTLVQVPTVIGWLKPVVLFPVTAMTGLSASQLEALLAHELAHIRRHDYLVNILQTAIEIFGFYHPAIWWVSRRIRIERENCCDDMAAGLAGDRVLYADALTTMAELRAHPGLAMAATGGSLFARIRRLAGKESEGPSRSGWIPAIAAVVLAGAVITLGAGAAWDSSGEAAEPADVVSAPAALDMAKAEQEVRDRYAAALPEIQEYILWTARTFGRSGMWLNEDAFAGMSDARREQKIEYLANVLIGSEYGRHLCQALAEASALKDRRLVPGLMKIAAYQRESGNYDCRPKWIAVSALARQESEQAVPLLISLVDHGNQNTRKWARAALARKTGQDFKEDKQGWAKWRESQGNAPVDVHPSEVADSGVPDSIASITKRVSLPDSVQLNVSQREGPGSSAYGTLDVPDGDSVNSWSPPDTFEMPSVTLRGVTLKQEEGKALKLEARFSFVGDISPDRQILVGVKLRNGQDQPIHRDWLIQTDGRLHRARQKSRTMFVTSEVNRASFDIPPEIAVDTASVEILFWELSSDDLRHLPSAPQRLQLGVTDPDENGDFHVSFVNPDGLHVDPSIHGVALVLEVSDTGGERIDRIVKRYDARPLKVGERYRYPLQVAPSLYDHSFLTVTFYTKQPDNDAFLQRFFVEGRGVTYKGIWREDKGALWRIPLETTYRIDSWGAEREEAPEPDFSDVKWETVATAPFDDDDPGNTRFIWPMPGITWDITNGTARASGVTETNDWAGTRIRMPVKGDAHDLIEISGDFKLQQSEGYHLVALFGKSPKPLDNSLCMYFQGRDGIGNYHIQQRWMETPSVLVSGQSRTEGSGEETNRFHTMHMVLDRASSFIYYFVDDRYLGAVRADGEIGPIRSLIMDFESFEAGNAAEILYDNLTVRSGRRSE